MSDAFNLIVLAIWVAAVSIHATLTEANLEILRNRIKKLEDRDAE